MRLRDKIQLKNVNIKDIDIELAPLETNLIKSLIKEEQKDAIQLYENGNGYGIIDGRRRLTALIEQGETQVLALVLKNVDNREIAIRALIANSGTPNPMDEAKHIAYLRDTEGLQCKDIAEMIGYSTARVCQTLKLADSLIPELQEKVQSGEMKKSAAQKAADLPLDKQIEILNSENFSLRNVSEIETEYQVRDMIFDTVSDEKIKPGLFLDYEKVKKLMDGEVVGANYDGVILMLKGEL